MQGLIIKFKNVFTLLMSPLFQQPQCSFQISSTCILVITICNKVVFDKDPLRTLLVACKYTTISINHNQFALNAPISQLSSVCRLPWNHGSSFFFMPCAQSLSHLTMHVPQSVLFVVNALLVWLICSFKLGWHCNKILLSRWHKRMFLRWHCQNVCMQDAAYQFSSTGELAWIHFLEIKN